MRRHCLILLLALALAGLVRADPPPPETCIEFDVARADLVVHARVVRSTTLPARVQNVLQSVTLDVIEVIRGKPVRQVTVLGFAGWRPYTPDWADAGSEVLLCLWRNDPTRNPAETPEFRAAPYVVATSSNDRTAIPFDPDGHARRIVFTMDFDVLADRAAILNRAREAARACSSSTGASERLDVPHDSPAFASMGPDIAEQGLEVPVNSLLEQRARAWAGDARDVVRYNAIAGLKHFRSEEDARLLRSLCRDGRHEFDGQARSLLWETRHYEIRARALAALRAWDAAPADVVTDESLLPDRPLRQLWWVAAPLVPAIGCVLLRRRRWARLALCLLPCAAVALLALRSASRLDAILVPGKAASLDVASYHYALRLRLADEAPSVRVGCTSLTAGEDIDERWGVGGPGYRSRSHSSLGFGFDSLDKPYVMGMYTYPAYRLWSVPYWCLLVVAALWPALGLRRIVRRRRRIARGLCPRCGYDLRASPVRCPECGREITRRRGGIQDGKCAV